MRTSLILAGLMLLAACSYGEIPPNAETVTFVVRCYTVGEHALEGNPGVLSVEPGWRRFREVDRVVYDPRRTSIEQMEQWLRESGTYVETISAPGDAPGRKESE